jgi:biopolymer transport protein ExbD
MKVQAENAPYDDINITPMLDLSYVLLIIFIIMTTASVQGVKINLPKASNSPSLAKPQTKAITVTEDGRMFLDTYPVTMTELEQQLRSHKAVNPEFPVVVKGDAKVQYEKVIDILDLLGRLEITQLGLVTQKLVK